MGEVKEGVFVSAGEFFLDLIFYDLTQLPSLGEELKTDNFAYSLGGGAAISAAAASRLGRETKLLTVWGDSPLDSEAQSSLLELGVDSSSSPVLPDTCSGLTVAVSTREDRYFLTCPGANRFVERSLLSEEGRLRLKEGRHVHLALTPGDWEPFGLLVAELQAARVTVSWDLGWDPASAESPGFGRLRSRLDLLFLNEMEALRYSGAQSVEGAIARLCSPHNTVVIKRGEKGAVGAQRGAQPVESKGVAVTAVESTGAGDAFNGGFIHAWMSGCSLEDSLLAGNICGALSTRKPGGVAALPSREEFLDRFEELKSRK
ncbi:MAG: carbohydrate kinase family protein [Acidobacteriota bacterium]